MRITIIIFLLSVSSVFSQENIFNNYRLVDTTQYKTTRALFLHDLTLKESHNEGKVILEWKNQRNITFHLIEMRDPTTGELIYRQKHYTNIAEFPKEGDFTIYPLFKKQKGEPVSINYEDAAKRNFEPISSDSYFTFLEKQSELNERKANAAAARKKQEAAQKEYENARANRITPKVVILIGALFFFAFVIVFTIWLVRYLTKPKESEHYLNRDRRKRWD
ncbi:hypothetical protein LX97_00839 [Nonlabens dokdonensis]|uniref:Uncharacterized protein n=2 Tax=Nonlabens dokdonensis TaxID=328515 RepID=L7W8M7_NONDD|nr:hypothetical protein [Nonlabens dokdonensis]AGC76166.1 hypothetical protein DDD_1039 [Nonlabens dokdonensis DSW-6]PZX43834.1 hypothetical protein LX97_00839 [Nonlabens dokdonensis]